MEDILLTYILVSEREPMNSDNPYQDIKMFSMIFLW